METLNQIAAQLGLDSTFFYLFGLVFVLYLFLSNVYLKPFQQLLVKRRENIDGVKKQAAELASKAEEKFAVYRTELKAATDKARQVVRESEDSARKEEARVLSEASAKAKQSLQVTMQELEQQGKAAASVLEGQVSNLANEIATKVIGRPMNG